MPQVIPPLGSLEVTLAASDKVCVATRGKATFAEKAAGSDKVLDSANPTYDVIIDGAEFVSDAFATGGSVLIQNMGPFNAYVEVGTAPLSKDFRRETGIKGAAIALDVSGDITFAMMAAGSITSAAATVQADLATAASLEAGSDWAIGEGLDWGVVKVGANTLTVTASAGHTLQGSGAVATTTSATFRTVKTAASTFVTTRTG